MKPSGVKIDEVRRYPAVGAVRAENVAGMGVAVHEPGFVRLSEQVRRTAQELALLRGERDAEDRDE